MQQINLYTQLEKPSPFSLSPKRAMKLYLAAIIIFIFILAFNVFSTITNKISFYYTSKKVTYLTNKLEKNLFVPADKRVFKNYAEQMLYQRKLLKTLAEYEKRIPFQPSLLMRGIAKSATKNIAIKKLEFSNSGKNITIEGEAERSIDVLNFEKTLHTKLGFKHIIFRKVDVNENQKDELIQFTLSTEEK